ncbi:MAG: carboxypeptidase-like regulatory domain-containing protein [Flavobacteriales bacterium]|nr:carboxypeptidase-like regulatory domain-containing protein [Flavobacteriales bacterium]
MKNLFFILLVLMPFLGLTQNATIKGKLVDELGIRVADANIVVEGTEIKSFTDKNGKFDFFVPANTPVTLVFSHITYKKKKLTYLLSEGQVKVIYPVFKYRVLPEFTVTTKRTDETIETLINIKGVEIPSIGNFESRLGSEMGVTMNNELSSGYNVRGGNFEENLIYVNGIEIYRPFLASSGQQEGLSFINSNMVEDIQFSAGGFQARYGDKLSSVLDVTYKKPTETGGSVTLSMLGANLHFEGISENFLWTHVTAARFQSNRYVFGALDTKGEYQPLFGDLQTYLTYTPSEHWEHSFLGNFALNRYQVVPQNRETSFGSINQALRFTVFFDGSELTQYQTFTGAFSSKYTPNDSTELKFIASAFNTYQEEIFDVEGQYFLDELERDPGKENFGDVAFNLGVGGFLRHARNTLDATVTTIAHKGVRRNGNKTLQWGGKAQYDIINDNLKEWDFTDSTGFIAPRPSDSVGYRDSSTQAYQNLGFNNVVRAKNRVATGRLSGYIQNTWRNNSKTSYHLAKTIQLKDTLITIDTTLSGYKSLIYTAGVRANFWTFNNEVIVSPRLSLKYRPLLYHISDSGEITRRNLALRVATGVYQQPAFYREYRRLDGSLNQNIQAQRSIHLILGADYIFNKWGRDFKLTSEVYVKYMDRVIPYDVDNVRIRYSANNDATAYSTGIDLKLNGRFIEDLESWGTISVMQTRVNLGNDVYHTYLNSDGDTIIPGFTNNSVAEDSLAYYPGFLPRPTDQRVSFGLFFQDKMPKTWNTEKVKWDKFKINLSFIYNTGFSYLKKSQLTDPAYQNNSFIPRTPRYLRVDAGFIKDFISEDYKAKEGSRFQNIEQFSISLEVFNLLGIDNTVSYNFVQATNGRQYAIPNRLTSRVINIKLIAIF